MTREEILQGPTYLFEVDGDELYLTLNENSNGDLTEIFVRSDNPEMYEWVTLTTVLMTRLLRAGQTPLDIARELKEIHSPRTRHFIPGGRGECPSLSARIGMMIEEYQASKE